MSVIPFFHEITVLNENLCGEILHQSDQFNISYAIFSSLIQSSIPGHYNH